MENLYPHVLGFVSEQPWALLPEKLATMLDLLRFRSGGGEMTPDEIRLALGSKGCGPHGGLAYVALDDVLEGAPVVAYEAGHAALAGPGGASRPVVAILGVYGVITQRADMMTEMSGGTSTDKLLARVRAAVADQAVKGIVLDVDSPGGGVYGLDELAGEIRAAKGVKPVLANINSLGASAAYWIASAAEEVSITPSGEAGSIGVFAAHQDLSEALTKAGVKTTLVSAGKFKTEGNPFEPLSEEARAAMQARVDDYYQAFVRSVAKGRGVTPEAVRGGFGQGRVVGAKQAVAEKMADRIETLDEAVRRMAGMRKKKMPMDEEEMDMEQKRKGRAALAEAEAVAALARLRVR